eukprot:1160962-Pelagomonas_calceolata.AAC.16
MLVQEIGKKASVAMLRTSHYGELRLRTSKLAPAFVFFCHILRANPLCYALMFACYHSLPGKGLLRVLPLLGRAGP